MFFHLIVLVLSEAVLFQPRNCFLYHIRDVSAILRDHSLLLQSLLEINMFRLGERILEVIVIIGETRIWLDLAYAVCLKDRADRNAMIHQALILIDLALPDRCALAVNAHGLSQHLAVLISQLFSSIACGGVVLHLSDRAHS